MKRKAGHPISGIPWIIFIPLAAIALYFAFQQQAKVDANYGYGY